MLFPWLNEKPLKCNVIITLSFMWLGPYRSNASLLYIKSTHIAIKLMIWFEQGGIVIEIQFITRVWFSRVCNGQNIFIKTADLGSVSKCFLSSCFEHGKLHGITNLSTIVKQGPIMYDVFPDELCKRFCQFLRTSTPSLWFFLYYQS